jgi:SAM-dependent methyltransferase
MTLPSTLTLDDLRQIAATVGDRQGWDFTRVRATRDPVPWYYGEVVRRYLKPSDTVLDTGTGGGEKFISLAPYYGRGIGIDASYDMVQTARANLTPTLAEKISFEVMSVADLQFPAESFDVVLNRHSVVNPAGIMRVLRPGGVFITQQVGPRNTANVIAAFGCTIGGLYEMPADQEIEPLTTAFAAQGGSIVCRADYDVPYTFNDVASLVFWLKAIPIPEDFDIDRHGPQVLDLIRAHYGDKGFRTNEHRQLLIVRKPA